ncbi:hypothetical protein R6258_06655 [Halomonas sp. HP20-15]|uniref:hypothetical protein n=1 Tax=Halomonas sp. HP20-15 TaxID=3085901 RepID=UPI002980E0F0|nr:hypothetical protein [Halomonas sp. HP20-15]MDW5376596.1 hypothetical protein [Halomonas sp. HP20-15]
MRSPKLAIGVSLLTLALSALTTINAWAEVSTEKAQQLMEQCQKKTVQHRDGKKLTGNPVKSESNAKSYKPGEPFELHINFTGHGNTVHNVTCQIDGQGKVSFKEVDQSGSAKK